MKQEPIERRPLERLDADPEVGLSQRQAQKRMAWGWGNRVTADPGKTEKQIVAEQCFTFFNLVFVVLAAVLVIGGSSIKNMTFLLVAVANTVIGIIQQIRAKRAVGKLSLLAARKVTVIRDGQKHSLPNGELVRDDIVEIGPGDQICADGILRLGEVKVNESLITGEADAIAKEPGDKLMSGSFVVAGRGRFQLVNVGDDSFAAQLAAKAKEDPKVTKSEMMRSLDKLIKVVGIALIPIGIAMLCQELIVLKEALRTSVESTVAALIGMIPEGLYLLTSVAMAASALKLTRQKVLVQDLNCIESLARVDVLCVDKTGTITEPKMEVEDILPLSQNPPEYLQAVMTALYGSDEAENDTAAAIREVFPGESDWVCTRRIPFSSQYKWSGAEFEEQGAFLTGAPEYLTDDEEILEQTANWAEQGYRVLLAAAYQGQPQPGALEPERLSPLALIVLASRIRPEAPETFRYFAEQGVTVKVISGDNPVTVSQVAGRAGIPNAEKYVDATTLQTKEDIAYAAENYTVFGRVTPNQKKALIRALKKAGHTVAMTGDGVNDVLAMKESDCGIAMASGAQAASQVAQLVLLESDFSAMPGIVGEGRRVINNIQRAATLFLVKNIFSLAHSIITLFTQWQYPMMPLHLSILSALTIGAPSFFLAMEPNYERVSGRFLTGVLRRALPGGCTNIFVVLMAQAFMQVFELPFESVRTVCTAILCVVGLLVLFQVCKPMNRFRKIIWAGSTAAVIVCFTVLNEFFELITGSVASKLVMATLLIMTPTVFFAFQRLFDYFDKLAALIKERKSNRHADL